MFISIYDNLHVNISNLDKSIIRKPIYLLKRLLIKVFITRGRRRLQSNSSRINININIIIINSLLLISTISINQTVIFIN
jgi:hypothetical protein